MATHRLPILGANTVPDSSGDVFFEPYSIKAANDVWDYLVCIFNNSGNRDGLRGKFDVPQGYVGSAKIIVVWTSTVISGDVEFDFDYRCVGGDDIESLDQAGTQETVNQEDIAPSAIHERMEASLSLTSANVAPGDTCQFEFFRDGVDAGDTMAAAAIVHDLFFEYTDA